MLSSLFTSRSLYISWRKNKKRWVFLEAGWKKGMGFKGAGKAKNFGWGGHFNWRLEKKMLGKINNSGDAKTGHSKSGFVWNPDILKVGLEHFSIKKIVYIRLSRLIYHSKTGHHSKTGSRLTIQNLDMSRFWIPSVF